jgi:hypothetical protein
MRKHVLFLPVPFQVNDTDLKQCQIGETQMTASGHKMAQGLSCVAMSS